MVQVCPECPAVKKHFQHSATFTLHLLVVEICLSVIDWQLCACKCVRHVRNARTHARTHILHVAAAVAAAAVGAFFDRQLAQRLRRQTSRTELLPKHTHTHTRTGTQLIPMLFVTICCRTAAAMCRQNTRAHAHTRTPARACALFAPN